MYPRSVILQKTPLLSVSCRNNPVAGIMALIPLAELAPQLCGSHRDGLVPSRGGCATAAAGAVHLPRPFRSGGHEGLSVDDAGASATDLPALSTPSEGNPP